MKEKKKKFAYVWNAWHPPFSKPRKIRYDLEKLKTCCLQPQPEEG